MFFLVLLFALFLSAEAGAQNCDYYATNQRGAWIAGVFHFNATRARFSGVSTDADEVIWNPPDQFASGSNATLTIGFTAEVANEHLWSRGNGSGCSFEITEIDNPVDQPYLAIKQFIKDSAGARADDMDWWNTQLTYKGPIALVIASVISPTFAVDLGYTLSGVGIILTYKGNEARQIAKDPPTPDQCYIGQDPQYVSPGDLGLGYAYSNLFGDGGYEYYYNRTIDDMLNLYAFGEMAYNSANAASGCAELGDLGAADWQASNAQWAVHAYAQYASEMADNFWAMGWYLHNYFTPIAGDDSLGELFDQISWTTYQEGQDLSQ